jgi:hypothetical protein
LTVSALGVAVAMAASSAAAGLEAAVVLGDSSSVDDRDLAVVRDFAGSGVPVLRADPKGGITHTATT